MSTVIIHTNPDGSRDGVKIRRGNYLHFQVSVSGYTVDAYRDKNGRPILRFGCEVHPLRSWTPALQRRLCARHNRKAAARVAQAVRTAKAFFNVGEKMTYDQATETKLGGDNMSAESICDGCGKRARMTSAHGNWLKPHDWFERTPRDERGEYENTITACCRECIPKAEANMRPGKDPMTVVLPI